MREMKFWLNVVAFTLMAIGALIVIKTTLGAEPPPDPTVEVCAAVMNDCNNVSDWLDIDVSYWDAPANCKLYVAIAEGGTTNWEIVRELTVGPGDGSYCPWWGIEIGGIFGDGTHYDDYEIRARLGGWGNPHDTDDYGSINCPGVEF